MTLLMAVFAAVTSIVVWYLSPKARKLKVEKLCYMFSGASIMWFVDAIFEYAELKEEYFKPSGVDMLNDFFLGLSVIALALVVWVCIILVTDPLGNIKGSTKKVA